MSDKNRSEENHLESDTTPENASPGDASTASNASDAGSVWENTQPWLWMFGLGYLAAIYFSRDTHVTYYAIGIFGASFVLLGILNCVVAPMLPGTLRGRVTERYSIGMFFSIIIGFLVIGTYLGKSLGLVLTFLGLFGVEAIFAGYVTARYAWTYRKEKAGAFAFAWVSGLLIGYPIAGWPGVVGVTVGIYNVIRSYQVESKPYRNESAS